jgi:hypothetical protein
MAVLGVRQMHDYQALLGYAQALNVSDV